MEDDVSKNFLLRGFLKIGSYVVASASVAISVLFPIMLNSSKVLANGYYYNGTPVDINNALQDLFNKNDVLSLIAFAPNGGWVIINGSNGYTTSTNNPLRQDFIEELSALNKQGQSIDSIAFTPTGEWVIIYNSAGAGIAESQNLPQEVVTALSNIKAQTGVFIKISFSPNGGYVITYNRNSYSVSSNISPEIVTYLSTIKKNNGDVNAVAFSPDGGCIIVYDDSDGFYTTQGIPQTLTSAIQNLQKNTPGSYVAHVSFTSSNGWTLINDNAF